MTEFKVEVVRIGTIEKHPNADSLSITQVMGGYPCIIKTGDFSEGELAVYVPVDSLVHVERPEFAFLAPDAKDGFARIKAKRLRGVFSMGLLVKAQPGAKEGSDKQAELGVGKWLPPAEREQQQSAPKPKWPWWRVWLARLMPWWFAKRRKPAGPSVPVYDIEGWRKYKNLFQDGEIVSITEKIHGANFRAVWTGGKLHIGSRTQFGRDASSDWGKVAEKYDLATKLRTFADVAVFGEVYGNVQDLKYGKPNSVDLVVFDLMDLKTRRFYDRDEFLLVCQQLQLPTVPELYRGPWSGDRVALAEGKTTMLGADHVREGIVIKPVVERVDSHFGRVILKLAGEGYLTRKTA